MMRFLLAAAHAAPSAAAPPPVLVEAIGELSEVPSVTLHKGVLTADTAWLRDGTDCVEVQLKEDPPDGQSGERVVSWEACADGPISCTRHRSLGVDWGRNSFFYCRGPDGSGWAGGSGRGSSSFGGVRDLLVRHDDEAAVWASSVSLQAAFRVYRTVTRPCTPASADHGTPSPDGPVQVCDASEGINIGRVHADRIGIGAKTSVSTDPIDCSRPCSVGEDDDVVREANLWLSGRRFYDKGAPHYGIYATEALCRAAPPSIALARHDGMCQVPTPPPEP